MSLDTPESAATVPEQEPSHAPDGDGLKRRHDGESAEVESKRQKTDAVGDEEPAIQEVENISGKPASSEEHLTAAPSETATADIAASSRKKSSAVDEKQRSRRLFGALLGNLNQPSDRVSKLRAGIEQRKKAELQKQDEERLEDRQKRLEILNTKRRKEQIRVDEDTMRIRHKNMLEAANFLQTKTEPKLFYRPWDLLPDEEDRIDEQIKDTEAQIEKEVTEFEEGKRKRLEFESTESISDEITSERRAEAENITSSETLDQPAVESTSSKDNSELNSHPDYTNSEETPPADHKVGQSDQDVHSNDQQNEASHEMNNKNESLTDRRDELEDEGDHVVEGGEDTVIY